ncbi:sphingomyelin phosphodiesterase-like [Tigriopus californicus]|uniref:sphingomyelin phosphodiesterase-like n=1 Tax=Tigriopus californicus TaxID=6832 RepID=UPI0027DAA11F|nr:sphingomyelin phosphodiesterase-like [Tigriopus californicus]
MRGYLVCSVFLLVTGLSKPILSFESNEHLQDALLAIGHREMELPLDWHNFERGLWPYFDALRHIDIFEERTKIVHKLDDRVELLHQGPLENITCALCDSFIKIVLDSVDEGTPVEDIQDLIANICMDLHIEADTVCQGIVSTYGPILKFVIDGLGPKATPELFCGVFLDEYCMSTEVNDLVNNWEVTHSNVPKPPFTPPTLPEPEATKLKVLHLTDLHIDLSYLPGSNPDCGMPCCCMNTTGLAQGDERRAGYWGDIADCDLPIWTFEAMLQQIKEDHGSELAYTIYTGDSPPHDVWQQSKESNFEHSKRVLELYKQYLPNVPLYLSLGNHEGFPVNSFPPEELLGTEYSGAWLFEGVGDLISEWITPEATNTFKVNGRYSIRPYPGMKIINLNNNFGVGMNMMTYFDFHDPASQLAWLSEELQESEDLREKVHILTHHPNGKCIRGWREQYAKIVHRYESTIAATFVGHTHKDSFEIWIDGEGQATMTTFIGPSVTPRGEKSPEYKIFTIDGGYEGASWQVLDYDTYIMDVMDYNDPEVPPRFYKFYSALKEFEMNSMYPEDWKMLLERAMTDDDLYETLVRFQAQNIAWADEDDERREFLCKRIIVEGQKDNTTCPLHF